MSIILTQAVRIAGAVVLAGPTVLYYAADVEADLVARKVATYVVAPSFPSRELTSAQAAVISAWGTPPLNADTQMVIRQALGIIKTARSGHSVDVWQGGKAYEIGDRIFPTAYLADSTYTTGFVSAGGALYCLVAITAGMSGATEPTWKDPATIAAGGYGYLNAGTGAGLLDITDGGVTWRIRPAIFIDPVNGNNTGATRGTQLNPYLDWSVVCGTGTAANPWSTTIGCVYNDDLTATTGDHQIFAGAVFLQRAGTTVTGTTNPVITVRGGLTDSQGSYWNGATDTASWKSPRRLTFGCYRRPVDVARRAIVTRTGSSSSTATGTIFSNLRSRFELLDFDVSNATPGNNQNGALIYTTHANNSSDNGNARIRIAGCLFHDCVGGSGMPVAHFGGNSTSIGVNGVLVEDCDFYENMGMGSYISGNCASNTTSTAAAYSVRFVRCASWNNGKVVAPQAYHHGMSNIAHRMQFGDGVSTGLSGWTLTSGTTYSRPNPTPPAGMVATIDDIPAVTFRSGSGAYPGILKRNTATPTTPAAGEYGYNGTNLYVNLGAALISTIQFTAQLAPCKDIQYESCEAFGIQSYTLSGVLTEGFGFAADEFSVVSYLKCFSHHNQQAGFFFHYGNGSSVRGSYSYANHSTGVTSSCTQNTVSEDSSILYNGSSAADLLLNFGLTTAQGSNPSIGIYSIFGSSNTVINNNNIVGSMYGVVRFVDPTTPYDNTTFALRSTFTGSGNRISTLGGANYSTLSLGAIPSLSPTTGFSGDTAFAS